MFRIVIISGLLFATALGEPEAPYPAESPLAPHYSPPAGLSRFASPSQYPARVQVPAQSYQIPQHYFQGQLAPPVSSYPVVAGGLLHAHAPAFHPVPRSEKVFPGFVTPLTETGFLPSVPRTNYGLPSLGK